MNRVVDRVVEIDGGEIIDVLRRLRLLRARARARARRSARPPTRASRRCSRRSSASSSASQTHAAKAAQVQSRVKKLEKIETIELPQPRARSCSFDFRTAAALGRRRRRCSRASSKAYGERAIYDGFDFLDPPRRALVRHGRERRRQDDAPQDGRRRARARRRHGAPRRVAASSATSRSSRSTCSTPTSTVLEQLQQDFPLEGAGHRSANLARRVPVLGRRRGQAGPRPLGRREVAPRPRADALRPAELPRPRRADEPPRPRDEGDARRARSTTSRARCSSSRTTARSCAGFESRARARRARTARAAPRSPTAARTPSTSRGRATSPPGSTHNRAMPARRFAIALALFSILTFAGATRARFAQWTTSDEPPHLAAARERRRGPGMVSNFEHPVLMKVLAGSFLRAGRPDLERSTRRATAARRFPSSLRRSLRLRGSSAASSRGRQRASQPPRSSRSSQRCAATGRSSRATSS